MLKFIVKCRCKYKKKYLKDLKKDLKSFWWVGLRGKEWVGVGRNVVLCYNFLVLFVFLNYLFVIFGLKVLFKEGW